MKSLVYARVRIVVEHPEGVDPEDVVNDCNYDFEANIARGDKGTITDTEITEVNNHGELDENGALKIEDEDDEDDEDSE